MFVWADDRNTNSTNRREGVTVVFICLYLILFVWASQDGPNSEQQAAFSRHKGGTLT